MTADRWLVANSGEKSYPVSVSGAKLAESDAVVRLKNGCIKQKNCAYGQLEESVCSLPK